MVPAWWSKYSSLNPLVDVTRSSPVIDGMPFPSPIIVAARIFESYPNAKLGLTPVPAIVAGSTPGTKNCPNLCNPLWLNSNIWYPGVAQLAMVLSTKLEQGLLGSTGLYPWTIRSFLLTFPPYSLVVSRPAPCAELIILP